VKPILRPTGTSPPLAHLPYCSSHEVSIVKIERRKARREWRDLVAGIEDGERFGSNRLKFAQGGCFAVGHYDNMRVDWENIRRVFWASSRGGLPGDCSFAPHSGEGG
jgi:hypothetical protein